jgi:hypothetical protein
MPSIQSAGVYFDRVRETTNTSGTGTVTLNGAVTAYQSFAAVGDGNTCYYCITDLNSGDWEVGVGKYTLSGTTLARSVVISSSNANALVSFQASYKDVFLVDPAWLLSRIPFTFIDHYASVGSSGTSETTLYTDTLPAGILSVIGEKLVASYGCTLVNSSSTKEIKLYFAGSVIFDTGALSVSAAGDVVVNATIICDTSTSVRYMVGATATGVSVGGYASVGTLAGLTLTGTNVLKLTGTAAGLLAANGDVTAIMGTVAKYRAG